MTKVLKKLVGKAPEESWDKLFDFMDANEFTVSDFLACVCASLARYGANDNNFDTEICVGGQIFEINIKKGKKL